MTAVRAPQHPYHPSDSSNTINPWLIRLPILMLVGGILFVLLMAIAMMAYVSQYDGKIAPGVSALGVDLGGMNQEEAVAALSSRFTYDQNAVFTFVDNERTWQLTAGDLGVVFDVDATVAEAMSIANSGNFTEDLVDQSMSWLNGESVAPIIRYDQSIAVTQLNTIAEQVDQPAVNGSLAIEGVNIVGNNGQAGRTVDVATTLSRLENMLLTLSTGAEIPVAVNEQLPTIWNVDEPANRARSALSGSIELVAEGQYGETLGPWTASVEQIATLLNLQLVDNGNGTQSYQVSVDVSAFQTALEELAPGLITQPEDGRFNFDDATGQLVVTRPSVYGRALNVEQTLAQLEEAIFRFDNRRVSMAFDYVAPRYHDNITAQELGITSMVSEATTTYAGSPVNRIHNITEGVSRFDGLIIAPGEEFSFNYWLGEMSEDAGFVQSLVIQGERTVDGIGGGICQVSTTAFRAAWHGGFRIIERNSHAYRVGYYEMMGGPVGLDAAIWTPDRDMRFQNDTPYHLLIEVSVNPANQTLQFRFYSTNPGRVVTVDEPIVRNLETPPPTIYQINNTLQAGQVNQLEWAADGADVTVYRTITDLQGNLITEDYIYTHYLPWGALIEVPAGDSRANG